MSPGFELPGVPAALLGMLQGAAGDQRLALVGGAVRDLLLHRVHNDPWRGLPDLDLVVEGSAAQLVGRLQAELNTRAAAGAEVCLVAAHEYGAYGTVELELQLAGQTVLLDVATARREQYLQLGENPQVRFGALEQDLARRDFTINAIALVLANGQLLDPHGGQHDLQRRQLRWLHPGSVADDPTRLVRGARYGARLGFELAPQSQLQACSTLAAWPWSWHPGDPPAQAPSALGTRLRMELELLLAREPWPQALALLQRWGGLQLLDPALQAEPAPVRERRLRWAKRFGLPLLPALLARAADPLALAERLQLPHRHRNLLSQWLELRQRWPQQEDCAWNAAQWCQWLEAPPVTSDAVAFELAVGQGVPRRRRPLLRWWLRWRHCKAPCTAAQLMAREGLRPGPALGARLMQLRLEQLLHEAC